MCNQTGSPGEPVSRVRLGVLKFLKEPFPQGSSRHPSPGVPSKLPKICFWRSLRGIASLHSFASLESFASFESCGVPSKLPNICFWRSLFGKLCKPSKLCKLGKECKLRKLWGSFKTSKKCFGRSLLGKLCTPSELVFSLFLACL